MRFLDEKEARSVQTSLREMDVVEKEPEDR